MADEDWDKPHRPPAAPRQPTPGELLFEFYREHDHTRWMCELRDHGELYGVEAQFFRNEELFSSRRFDRRLDPTRAPRELAVAWADEERQHIETARGPALRDNQAFVGHLRQHSTADHSRSRRGDSAGRRCGPCSTPRRCSARVAWKTPGI